MSQHPRLQRLLQILDLLQSGRWPKAQDLADLCRVSERTIYRDLQALQDAGFQIQHDPWRQGYRLGTHTFLRPAELTTEETLALILLATEAEHDATWLSRGAQVKSALLKLSSNLPPELLSYVEQVSQLAQVQSPHGRELTAEQPPFEAVRTALTQQRCLRITYHSLSEHEDIKTRLSPYHVLHVRRSWYVIGYSTVHRSVRTFKIGRIREWTLVDVPYSIPPRFSVQKFLGNAWQLIREPGPSQQVEIRFQPLVAENVADVLWHKTQEVLWNEDGSLLFRVRVDGLNEISWWVLGYGDQAEVIQPPALRELICQRARSLLQIYEATN